MVALTENQNKMNKNQNLSNNRKKSSCTSGKLGYHSFFFWIDN